MLIKYLSPSLSYPLLYVYSALEVGAQGSMAIHLYRACCGGVGEARLYIYTALVAESQGSMVIGIYRTSIMVSGKHGCMYRIYCDCSRGSGKYDYTYIPCL